MSKVNGDAGSEGSWRESWHALLEEQGYDLRRGRSFARRGRVQGLEVQVGKITAQVQDADRGECEIEIRVNTFSDPVWGDVFDRLASQAFYLGELLAGNLPIAIDEVFREAGVELLPVAPSELENICDVCNSWEQPCKHSVAVLYLVGQMLDADPWLIFRLRGRDRQQVLQALRRRRSDECGAPRATPVATNGTGSTLAGFLSSESNEAAPLAGEIDRFWGKAKELRECYHHIGPPLIRLALLRRLGRPPFAQESLESYDTLRSIYETVSEAALDLAFAPEPDE